MVLREGTWPLAATLAGAALATWLGGLWAGVPLWLLAGILLLVFHGREPPPAGHPLSVLSPVDGVVSSVSVRREPWLEGEHLGIRVSLTFPGVAVLRSPTEGRVVDFQIPSRKGHEGDGRRRGSPVLYVVRLCTDEGVGVTWALRAVRIVSRLRLEVSPGERVGQGRRAGFVYFGRHAEVLVPTDSQATVKPGQAVRAGVSILAELASQRRDDG